MTAVDDRWGGPALSLLRIVTALLLLVHATSKLFDFPPFGMPVPAGSLLWVAGVIELIFGTLVLIGFQTRIAAFILSGEMAVGYWMFHAPQSTFPTQNGGESAILFCFIFLAIAAIGAGPWSIDAGRGRGRVVVADDGDLERA